MADPALRKFRFALWALVVIAALGALYFLSFSPKPQENASDYSASIGGPFALTAANGSTVTNATLKGEPYAIFFGFTRCPDVCPTSLARLTQLRQKMGAKGNEFRIVFVSVDSGRDTPADVGNYVALFHTPIIGLTGTDNQIATAAKSFGVYYEKVPEASGDYTIDHTATVFLMDRKGRLQSTIDAQEYNKVALAKLRRLVA